MNCPVCDMWPHSPQCPYVGLPEAAIKDQTRLVRMSDALFHIIADTERKNGIRVDWGKPIEYVLSEDNGKNYMEPVYGPNLIYNDNNDLEE